MEIIQNTAENRFETTIEGHLSIATYVLKPDSIAITHTGVPVALRGKGVAAELVKAIFDYAEKNNLRVIPICPYVNTFIQRYPEYKKFM